MPPPIRRRRAVYRARIPIISRYFPNLYFALPVPRVLSVYCILQFFTTSTLYILGPVLILVTFGLVYALSYTYWKIIIPLYFGGYTSPEAIIHQSFVLFILVNVVFNYYSCVTTRNFGMQEYHTVAKELALSTGFEYPQNEEELEKWRVEWRESILERARQKRLGVRHDMTSKCRLDEGASGEAIKQNEDQNTNHAQMDNNLKRRKVGLQPSPPGLGRSWMWFGPYDWSFCERTGLPKPPRSHYDHVTKALVMNMDHYCPWMFNVVGYFNYRYFCNFLIYVSIGMLYGTLVSFEVFFEIGSKDYYHQINLSRDLLYNTTDHRVDFRFSQVQHLIPHIPVPVEATPISFAFMMCVSVGLAVSTLMVFHIYLIVTAQTTIEFHGNRIKKRQSKNRGEVYCNPYDLGIKRNVEQIWGTWPGKGWFWFWLVLLPSRRKMEFLPVPFEGDGGRRDQWRNVGKEEEDIGLIENMV